MTGWIALLLSLPGAVAALLGILNRRRLQEIKVHVNSRLDEAIAVGKSNLLEKAQLREQVVRMGGDPDESIPHEEPGPDPLPPEVLPYPLHPEG